LLLVPPRAGIVRDHIYITEATDLRTIAVSTSLPAAMARSHWWVDIFDDGPFALCRSSQITFAAHTFPLLVVHCIAGYKTPACTCPTGHLLTTTLTEHALPIMVLVCRRLEEFQLQEALYRGKTSLLYHAIDKRSGMEVALKLYRKRKLSTLNKCVYCHSVQLDRKPISFCTTSTVKQARIVQHLLGVRVY
jgi:hypothetical protein